MKIGEFSSKFQVSEDTVRYYIKLGILVPDSQSRQYHFENSDEADMEMILRLKSEGFTLREIHRIVSLYRISKFAAPEDQAQLEAIYSAKQRELTCKLRQVRASIGTVGRMRADCAFMGTGDKQAEPESEVAKQGED